MIGEGNLLKKNYDFVFWFKEKINIKYRMIIKTFFFNGNCLLKFQGVKKEKEMIIPTKKRKNTNKWSFEE